MAPLFDSLRPPDTLLPGLPIFTLVPIFGTSFFAVLGASLTLAILAVVVLVKVAPLKIYNSYLLVSDM